MVDSLKIPYPIERSDHCDASLNFVTYGLLSKKNRNSQILPEQV